MNLAHVRRHGIDYMKYIVSENPNATLSLDQVDYYVNHEDFEVVDIRKPKHLYYNDYISPYMHHIIFWNDEQFLADFHRRFGEKESTLRIILVSRSYSKADKAIAALLEYAPREPIFVYVATDFLEARRYVW